MALRSTFRSFLLATLGFTLLFLVSCQKENSRDGSDEQQQMEASKVSSESDGEAEIIFNGLFDDILGVNAEVGLGNTGIFGRTQSCPTITVTRLNLPALFPVRIVLDFGINGCIHPLDGRFRKGKIIVEYTDRLTHPGAIATTTFDGFYIDSIKVEGTHKITNISNSNCNKSWKVQVINGKLTGHNGNYTMWNSMKTLIQMEGCSTPQISMDDIFKIEGTAEGKTLRGNLLVLWNSTIVEPLMKKFNCRWIVKGKIRTIRSTTNSSSPWVALLDFSPGQSPSSIGQCDRIASITINGVTHIITLP